MLIRKEFKLTQINSSHHVFSLKEVLLQSKDRQ